MAHEIEAENFFYSEKGGRAWHGIGKQLSDPSIAGLRLEAPVFTSGVSYYPAQAQTDRGIVEIPGSFVSVRDFDGKGLAVVGSQQVEAGASPASLLDSFERILAGRGEVSAAMMLREGRMMVLTTSIGQPVDLVSPNGTKDTNVFHYSLIAAFDGSVSTTGCISGTRIVCWNTYLMAVRDALRLEKVKHTRAREGKLPAFEASWQDALQAYEVHKRTIELLARAPFTDAQSVALFKGVLGIDPGASLDDISTRSKNNLDRLLDLQAGGRGNAPWGGTAWSAFNAVSEYTDHYMVVRGARSDGETLSTPDAQARIVDSKLFGAGSAMKDKAMDLIMAQIQA